MEIDDYKNIAFNEQFKKILNNKSQSHRETSKRFLKIASLKEKFIGNSYILVQDSSNLYSLADILDESLCKEKMDLDSCLQKINLNTICNNFTVNFTNREMKKETKTDIFKKFVLKNCKTYEDFFAFRNEFTHSYSSSMFFSHLIGNRIRKKFV